MRKLPLVSKIVDILSSKLKVPDPSKVEFKNNLEAAKHNEYLLKEHKNPLENIINIESKYFLAPGSEFRDVKELEKISGTHRLWSRMKKNITKGVVYDLVKKSEKERKEI